MKNIDLTRVWVILTKDYGENPARVVAVVSDFAKAQSWCGDNSIVKAHYWYEEVAID